MNIDEIIAQAQQELGIEIQNNNEEVSTTITNEGTIVDPRLSIITTSDTSSIDESFVDTSSSSIESEEQYEEENEDTSTEIQNTVSSDIRESVSRFRGAPWFEVAQQQNITLAGLGGIGSYVAFFLSRIRPNSIYLYDMDVIEAANMSGQLFGKEDLDEFKTSAVTRFANNYSDYYDIFAFNEFFTEDSEASDIMICGFDSMKSRKIFFNKWMEHIKNKKDNLDKCLFIDGRLSAESLQVFCITGDDNKAQIEYRKEWLFDDSDADSVVCSYKQTTYCAAMIGSIITNLFVNFCTNLTEPDFPRSLPFMTFYDADLMLFKTE